MTSSELPVALLVEDDEPVRGMIARMLRLWGFAVLEAAHGRQALDRLQTGAGVSLLVTDLMMPVMDGYDLLEAIRSHRALPAVAMTATLTLSERQEKRLGGAPLLYKPFTQESFAAAIDAARCAQPDFTYTIDVERAVVALRTSALATVEEKIAIVNRLWADPQYHHGYGIIVDRRGVDDAPPAAQASAFIRYVGQHDARTNEPSRWAIVADRPSVCRFYESMESAAAAVGVQMRAFQDYETAALWASGRQSSPQ